MKRVVYTDREGFKRVALIRDNDPDTAAPSGIPCGPPDVRQLDWQFIQREINNSLVDIGLDDWHDIQRMQNALTGVILSPIKRRLITLYRTRSTGEEVEP